MHGSFQHEAFRRKARKQMKLLLDSPWFYALPAPVRVHITDELMTKLSRVHVWGFLEEEVWDGDWETLLGKELLEAIDNFTTDSSNSNSQLRGRQFPPQYQFNIGQGKVRFYVACNMCFSVGNGHRRRQVSGVLSFARRAVVGTTWWLVQKSQGGHIPLLSSVGLFIASGFNPGLQLGLPLILSLLNGTDSSIDS